MPEPKIIKQEVVIVDSHEPDDYGNLKFVDKAGTGYKINSKRAHLFGLVEDGKAIELFWAKYMDKLYIADIKPVAEQIEQKPTGKIDDSAMERSAKEGKKIEQQLTKEINAYDRARNKSMAVSYVKDVICALISAGAIKSELTEEQWGKVFARADKVVEWMEK